MTTHLAQTLQRWQPEFTDIRRAFHAYPEIAFQEHRTSARVAELLRAWGLEVHQGLAGTGVVGTLRRGDAPRAVGLRADLDALPMTEVNTFEHASRNPGAMHACGHDGHTTMLLAAARYMAQYPALEGTEFNGTVHFIFQPAEEAGGGARRMMDDGLFDLFPVDAVFGMHNWPGLPVGHFGLTPGPIMASSNSFCITVQGRGGHGAMPHQGVDPVVAAAHLTTAFQSLISRELDPLESGVISVTQIHAGSADNVIPDTAVLRGTVRTLSAAALDQIETRMRELTQHLMDAMRCSAQFAFHREYPVTVNHAAPTQLCAQVLAELVGPDQLHTPVRPSMGAEDFAFMLQERPGCYVWIGNGLGEHRPPGHGAGPCVLHNTSYDFNDALIPQGAAYWVRLAHRSLQAAP